MRRTQRVKNSNPRHRCQHFNAKNKKKIEEYSMETGKLLRLKWYK